MEKLAKLDRARLWALPFFALALVVLFSEIDPARVWPVAALLFVALLVAAVPGSVWRELIESIDSASVGPVNLKLRRDAALAAAEAPESDTGEGVVDTSGREAAVGDDGETSMFDLRISLEYKLAYVAKHLLAEDGAPTFLTIGSLKYDGYLREEEARTALGILNTGEEELQGLSEAERERFLDEAGKFVSGVRASIFWGQVRRRLRGEDGPAHRNLLLDRMPSRNRRADFFAGEKGRGVRVAPAFAIDPSSRILEGAIRRLGKEGAAAEDGERQIVVVPDVSRVDLDPGGNPRVVKLAALRRALEHP